MRPNESRELLLTVMRFALRQDRSRGILRLLRHHALARRGGFHLWRVYAEQADMLLDYDVRPYAGLDFHGIAVDNLESQHYGSEL
jgi:hypothetical protein